MITGRGLVVVTAPTILPVSLFEAKQHVRAVDHDDDDALLKMYLRAAVNNAENFTGRAFTDRVLDYYLDNFPEENGPIELPAPPLLEVYGVFYSNSAPEQEYAADSYTVDVASRKARIGLNSGATWPTLVADDPMNVVRIRFRSGYIRDIEESPLVPNVPEDIKAAILLQVGTLYANRESVVIGHNAETLPMAWEHLLRPYRVHLALA